MAQTVGRFVFKKIAKYPHMKPADVAIWERFMTNHENFFDRVDYDFHVGEGADFLPTNEDTPDGRENRLYQKKIDVIGYKNNDVRLIEVKPIAGMSALGQILTYRELYLQSKGAHKSPNMMVICEKIMAEMKDVYKSKSVVVMVV